MSRPDQSAGYGWKLAAFRELRSSSNSALAALEALFKLEAKLEAQPGQQRQKQWPPLSFLVLKKHCLQLSVQAHKCIRLLATITDEDSLALQTALRSQLQSLARLLEDLPAGSSEARFLPIRSAEQNQIDAYLQEDEAVNCNLDQAKCSTKGCIITRTASRHFFRAGSLFPRINHALQQLDCSNLQSLLTISANIQQLILACPLSTELENDFAQAWQQLNPADDPDLQLFLYPRVHSEDGSRSSFAGLYPAKIRLGNCRMQSLIQAYKQILVSLYSPQCLMYMQTKGLRHERTEISALFLVDTCAAPAVSFDRMLDGSEIPPPLPHPEQTSAAKKTSRINLCAKACSPLLLAGQGASSGTVVGTVRIIHSLDDICALPEHTIAVVREASMDWLLLLPHIAALLIEAKGGTAPLLILARECSLPVVCGLENAASILQDGMQVTVDAKRGAVFHGIHAASLQLASPLPRTTAGAPVEQILRQICSLSGATRIFQPDWLALREPGILTCTSMLDIIRWCRFRAAQALLHQSKEKAVQLSAASLSFGVVHSVLPAQAPDVISAITTMEDIAPPPLHELWQGMAKQVQPYPLNQRRVERLNLKNSVLLGDKYCTVEMLCAYFSLYIDVDMDEPAQTFRLLFLLQDTRPNASERLQQLVEFMTIHGFVAQAGDTQLVAASTVTKRQIFVQHLGNLGTVCIQALL